MLREKFYSKWSKQEATYVEYVIKTALHPHTRLFGKGAPLNNFGEKLGRWLFQGSGVAEH